MPETRWVDGRPEWKPMGEPPFSSSRSSPDVDPSDVDRAGIKSPGAAQVLQGWIPWGLARRRTSRRVRLYRASGVVCQVCPAFGVCTRAKEIGRSLAIGPHDAVLRRHRAWMSTSAAREAYKLRKQLVEPVFGIIKEQQGARRFLLRGLVNVAAEWTMLATAFNLRTLWRVWRSSPFIGLFNGPEPCPVS